MIHKYKKFINENAKVDECIKLVHNQRGIEKILRGMCR